MDKESTGHLNSIAVKILLTAIFILLAAVITAPLIADLQFNAAQRLAQKYLWQEAQKKFQVAMRVDPFNAPVAVGFADFLKDISLNRADGNALLINSGRLYERALELDPFNAEYALGLAETELALFTRNKSKDNNVLKSALDNFKLALENDPNGFNVSYAVGYAGISVWDKLDAPGRKLVLDRLKYCLEIKPWYSEGIFSYIMQSTKDSGLLREIRTKESEQERKEKLSRIERIKQGNLVQPWQGNSGNNIYENGNMYWNGTIDAVLNVPEGEGVVKIQAKGSSADDVWPYMIVELDGEEIGETFVDSAEWKEYGFPVKTSAGLKVLSVTFLNDGGNAQKNEDRNLYVGEARVEMN
jgi:tetratricopeptide (TPR) repeat protein